jgi:hypothetical protein
MLKTRNARTVLFFLDHLDVAERNYATFLTTRKMGIYYLVAKTAVNDSYYGITKLQDSFRNAGCVSSIISKRIPDTFW